MSTDNATTDLTIKVPDYTVTTESILQYGMRYPNGDIKWVSTRTPNSETVMFDELAAGNGNHIRRWMTALSQLAEQSRIDLEEYSEGHQLIKRTVIVAVTKSEEVYS